MKLALSLLQTFLAVLVLPLALLAALPSLARWWWLVLPAVVLVLWAVWPWQKRWQAQWDLRQAVLSRRPRR